jgi:hypothetical protein
VGREGKDREEAEPRGMAGWHPIFLLGKREGREK